MTLPPLPLKDGCLFFSSTFLDWAMSCTRGAGFYALERRVSSTPASALNFGAHIHSAFEMHYRQQEFNTPPAEIARKVSLILEREFAAAPTEEGDFRTLNWAMEIYQKFVEKWAVDGFELMQYREPIPCKYCSNVERNQASEPCLWCNGTGKQSIMCEVPFAVKLFEHNAFNERLIPIYIHGFVDLPVHIKPQTFTLDFKTTSVLGNSFWDTLRRSSQQKEYAWAFQELTGQPVAGHIGRAIRTMQPPQWVLNGTTNKKGEYKKIESWWEESLVEDKIYLGPGEIEEWKQDTIAIIEEFLWHYGRGYLPHKRQWCSGKYGRCQYYEVCQTFPPADRELVLSSGLFKTKESIPLTI